MARLLISVRDAEEAEAALAGGADLIDIKEPANGPLGRADSPIAASIIERVAGRAPVSAACGELELCPSAIVAGRTFVKFGLAGWAGRDWPTAWQSIRDSRQSGAVAVAYADAKSCDAPSPDDVAAVAIRDRFAAFLIDTFEKNGRTLLDCLDLAVIAGLTRRCQDAGVPVALAGSLGLPEIARLRDVRPDWIAVRGAACRRGRGSSIDVQRVRDLKQAVISDASH